MPIKWDLSRRVVIRNLGETPTKSEIKVLFERYGQIKKLWVARNPPGIAFLEYESRRSAEGAARHLDGKSCCGSYIEVELSLGGSRYQKERNLGRKYRERRRKTRPERTESSKATHQASRSTERDSRPCSSRFQNVESSKSISTGGETHRCSRHRHAEDPNRSRSKTHGRQRLDCSICFGNIVKRNPTITPCRHVFCESCIRKAIQAKEKCPICQTITQEKQLQPIYLNP